ncbi:MAG: VPLPA-CTERM-specific exosortase XrtD, partial [Pseudomonadota bacterium]
PEYSHGPLIPLISGYLFLRQMKQSPPHIGPVDDRWPGVAVLLLALAIALFGSIVQIQKIVALGIIIWVGGMILVSFGWKRGKQFWPPVLHLVFMMPLPYFFYWKTSLALQHVSSEIGVEFIRMMSIPVYLEGNIIDLGAYKLHVAEACSGLRYLYPVMSFTYIFAVLYRGPLWHKAVLLLAAAPLTVLMNSFRVGVIGVMVDQYGIEYAEGFMHLFEGWVIFILTILLMIGLSRLMMILNRDGRSFAEVLDLDLDGLGEEVARIGHIRPSRALLGVTAATAIAAFVWAPLTTPDLKPIERDPFLLFPAKLGEWEVGRRNRLEPNIEKALRADDYLSVSLTDRSGAPPVDLFVAWYRDQGRAKIHSPEICIPAGGWEMSDIEVFDWTFQLNGKDIVMPVNRAVIQKGLSKQLVYYWFDQSGRRIASDYAAKAYLLIDAVRTGRTDGALVRFITPIGLEEPIERAEERLRSSIINSLPVMPDFIATEL